MLSNFFMCKISVDAFSFLYSKILLAKLCLCVFDATLLHSIGNLLAYVAVLYASSFCRLLSVRGRERLGVRLQRYEAYT